MPGRNIGVIGDDAHRFDELANLRLIAALNGEPVPLHPVDRFDARVSCCFTEVASALEALASIVESPVEDGPHCRPDRLAAQLEASIRRIQRPARDVCRWAANLSGDDEFMDVNEVLLPGVGLRYEFTNHDGERIGVIARRTGHFELVVYSRSDPDSSRLVMRLNSEEADTLAEILGAPRMAERFADLTKEVPGLIAGQVEVTAGSPFAGLPLGQTRARTRTGASIVAMVRSDDVIASPTPTEVLLPGDVLVVIGTHDGIAGVRQIIHP